MRLVRIASVYDWTKKNRLAASRREDRSTKIKRPWNAREATKEDMTFLRSGDGETNALVVFAPADYSARSWQFHVKTEEPRRDFFLCAAELFEPPAYDDEIVGAVRPLLQGSNCSIGRAGFGFVEHDGGYLRVPHYGGVVFGSNVEIGSNVCIDRGVLSDTIIGDGTKIDNLVHVAHNVRIGRNCLIIAGVVLGGSSVIEDGVTVSMNATVRNGIRIGARSFVGMGSVVTKDVPPDTVVFGSPAKPKK